MKVTELSSKKNSGFSLVELIVVIAIMAVMIGGGVITLAMLTGAEAKQGAKKMEAQLNDIKTGAMSRAGEFMIVRYIEVNDSNKDALAKIGIEKSGYYAEKRATTITNAKNIVVDYSTDPEFSLIGSKKLAIIANYDDDDKKFELNYNTKPNNAIRIEYNRGNGTLKSVKTGTVSSNAADATFTEGSEITLEKFEFQQVSGRGLHYIMEFDPVTSKHSTATK